MENQQLLQILSSSQLLIETCFFDPSEPSKHFVPFPAQCQLYNVVDYGYDITNAIDPKIYPEIVCMVFPRQTGKSEGVASLCAALMIRYPNCRIGVMSNTDDNACLMVDKIYFYIINSPFKDMVQRRRVNRLDLINGAVLTSFGQTENIRGNSFWWLIIDEAAQFDDKVLEQAAFPTTRAAGAFRKFGTPSIIMLSTPRGGNGKFIEYYLHGIGTRKVGCKQCLTIYDRNTFPDVKGWDHPLNLPSLPPCPKCGATTWEYINGNIAVVSMDPWKNPFMSPKKIQEELDLRGNTPQARQEILAEILSGGNNVFTRALVERCADPAIHNMLRVNPTCDYIMSADFGKLHDRTVFAVGHRATDTESYLDYMETLPSEGGLDYEDIRYRLLLVAVAFNPRLLVMDANGIGDPIVEQVRKDLITLQHASLLIHYHGMEQEIPANRNLHTQIYSNKGKRLGYVTDMKSKIEMIENLVNFFKQGAIHLPMEFEPEMHILYEELINYGYEYTGNDYIKYGTQRGHDDTVSALGMLCWGMRERPWFAAHIKLGDSDQFVL